MLRPHAFSGDKKVAAKWLKKFQAYLGATKIKQVQAVHTFYMLLEGSAEDWYNSLKDNQKQDIDSVYKSFRERYCDATDPSSPDYLDQFTNRTQLPKESVLDYIDSMKSAAVEAKLNDDFLKAFIIKGLLPSLRQEVRRQNPETLEDLRRVAKQCELADSAKEDPAAALSQLMAEMKSLRAEQAEVKALITDTSPHVAAASTPQNIEYQRQQPQSHPSQQPYYPDDYPSSSPQQPPGLYDIPHPSYQAPIHAAQYQPPWQPNRVQQHFHRPAQLSHPQRPCSGCGKSGHPRYRCWAQNHTCSLCHKIGHFPSVCRSATRQDTPARPCRE